MLVLATLTTGCNVDPYRLALGGDAGSGADAAPGVDSDLSDSMPDSCVSQTEVCDEIDNDCDDIVDNGFDLTQDPQNCGMCGNACDRPNMLGTCATSTCSFVCQQGFVDLDSDPTNGCEYACVETNGGAEACDTADNDCDGLVDEDFDLQNSVDDCGVCGRRCQAQNATAACAVGICQFTCLPGFNDLDVNAPGCEYVCPVNPPEPELCNNFDDDCDGTIDEGDPEGGAACGSSVGECTAGTETCQFGALFCVGAGGPSTDVCDGLDNDCDGTVDQDFDKDNDPQHCGSCSPCSLANAIEGCSAGVCTVSACEAGFSDADGLAPNGCEYACTPSGPEVCDGLDNDCDTDIDAADTDLFVPSNFCATAGPCSGTTPVCADTLCDPQVKWRCIYSSPAEVDSCGTISLQEAVCDDIDGDCDGVADETFSTKGDACGDSNIGACQGTGNLICNSMQDGVECDITTPGAMAQPEVCNGIDDDCNGVLDDDAPGVMVHVVNGPFDFWVDAYEASRPDSGGTTAGTMEHTVCSKPNVLPWSNVSWSEAEAACAVAGKRLCAQDEWQEACEGPLGLVYPYGNAYLATACNGNDYDPDCTGPDDDMVLPTATPYGCPPPMLSMCIGDHSTYDMSGNVMEWTSTQVGTAPITYRIRGGSFDNVAGGLTCQFSFVAAETTFRFDDLGFRCCSDIQL